MCQRSHGTDVSYDSCQKYSTLYLERPQTHRKKIHHPKHFNHFKALKIKSQWDFLNSIFIHSVEKILSSQLLTLKKVKNLPVL